MCPSAPGKSYVNLVPTSPETVKPTAHKSNSNIGRIKTNQGNKNRTLPNKELRGLKWVLTLQTCWANLYSDILDDNFFWVCMRSVHKRSSLSTDLHQECTNASSVKMKLQNRTSITLYHWNVLYASIGRAVRRLSEDIGWGKDRSVFEFEFKINKDLRCPNDLTPVSLHLYTLFH